MSDTFSLAVVDNGDKTSWSLEVERSGASYEATLTASDGRTWSTVQTDAFECLLAIREQVEPHGVTVCCNGARRNAWASGTMRQMAGGYQVYLLGPTPPAPPPPGFATFDPAPEEEVVTVEEQRAWYAAWLPR